jgi:hypothetical protein
MEVEGCNCASCQLARESKALPQTQQAAPKGRVKEDALPPKPLPKDEVSYAMEDVSYGQRLVDSKQAPIEREEEPPQKTEEELPTVPDIRYFFFTTPKNQLYCD